MQISMAKPKISSAPLKAAPKTEVQSQAPQFSADSVSFSSEKTSHFHPGKMVGRVVGGAITGVLAHHFGDGSTMGTAKLGAYVNGGIGAVTGGAMGALAGGAAGGGSGAVIGAGGGILIGGGIGAASGFVKGALVGVVGNAFGGGPIAFAASGAAIGLFI